MGTKPHVLVIGGTRGIGKAVCRVFRDEGAAVSVVARREPELPLEGPDYYFADITNGDKITSVLEKCTLARGKLTALVFLQRHRGEGANWDREIEVSLTATKNGIETAVPFFSEQGGSIVVVSSPASSAVAHEQPVEYHVAKAGVEQLVRYYAVKLGAKQIRVNAVSPAVILKEESRQYFERETQLVRRLSEATPLGRLGTADEVAGVIAFFCGPRATYLTGQVLHVDGGMTLATQASLVRKFTEPEKSL